MQPFFSHKADNNHNPTMAHPVILHRKTKHRMYYWKRLSHDDQDRRISQALQQNIDYKHNVSLGIPASRLDSLVFYDQASFLKEAPLLRAIIQNPNHIGVHTLGESEQFFSGTQQLEKEVIELLAVDLLKAGHNSTDGFIAAGGTEANLEAAWIYRNYFLQEKMAKHEEIALLASEDTHYSVAKAANILNLNWLSVPVHADTRGIEKEALERVLEEAKAAGYKYFIVIANMGTTMFGSVDDPTVYTEALKQRGLEFKMHVDGAFGGFIYPVSEPDNNVNFTNADVSSITLDAHKMLQAPYGTGVFLIRKGLIHYALTKEALYVQGMDLTVNGSRSGANAIAVWMILMTYGPFGWLEKINKLLYRTKWAARRLEKMGVAFYRHPRMNIITMRATKEVASLAHQYGLVPDSHGNDAQWYKIVVMDHVEIDHLEDFVGDLEKELAKQKVA